MIFGRRLQDLSKSIDEKIVEMQFDNKNFEKNVQSSLLSLDRLKKGLNLDSSARSLNNLGEVAGRFSLGGIADGVEGLKLKFSALGVIGVTALVNLTNSALRFGRKLRNLITDPIITGGFNRALNIEQAKFQFEGLGMDIEQAMEDALYAVKGTAYGLDQAAKAASQLGASGVKLGDDMKSSLRGISGVAAMTNRSYDDVARIFTTVAGNGRLMGMQLTQLSSYGLNVASVLAEAFGTTEAAVREMVSKGQIDFATFAKVMNDTFGEHATAANKTYSGSLSNVRAALSKIGEIVQEKRLVAMKDMFNALMPAIDSVREAIMPLLEGMGEGMMTVSKHAVKFLNSLDFTNLKNVMPVIMDSIRNALEGVLSILRPIGQAFRDVFKPATGDEIMGFAEGLRSITERFKIGEEAAEKIRNTFRGLFSILSLVNRVVATAVEGFFSLLGVFLPMGDGILGATGSLGSFLANVNESIQASGIFEGILNGLKEGFNSLARILGKVKDAGGFFIGFAKKAWGFLSNIGSGIIERIKEVDFNNVFDFLQQGLSAGILYGIYRFIDSAKGVLKNFSGVLGGVKASIGDIRKILDGVRDCLKAYQQQLKAGTLMKIAGAVAILAGALTVLSFIDREKLTTALTAITVLFIELFASMTVFEKLTKGSSLKSMTSLSIGLIGLSTAVLLLSFAMKNLDKLDWAGIGKGITAVAGLTTILIATAKVLSGGAKTIIKGAAGYIIFAGALVILTKAVRNLGMLSVSDLAKGLIGVGVLVTELAIFMRTADLDGMGFVRGVGLLFLAGAIKSLASSVAKLGAIDLVSLAKGLGAMGILLAELMIFLKLMGEPTKLLSSSAGLVLLGTAMNALARAIKTMGGMSMESIGKGLLTLAGALTILTVAMKVLQGGIVGAAALLIITGALAILTPILVIFGSLPISSIGKSLLMLAGVLSIFGGASILLAGAVPAMLGLAGAIIILGIGVAGVGAGLLALSIGLTTMAAGGSALVSSLIHIATSLIGLIPLLFQKVGEGLISIAKVIIAGAPVLIEAVVAVGTALLDAVIAIVPKAIQAVTTVLISVLDAIVEFVPKMVEAGMKIILGVLQGIASNIRGVVEAAIDIMLNFIAGVSSKLPDVIQAGFDIVISFINGLAEALRGNTDLLVGAIGNLMSAIVEAGLKMLRGSVGLFKKVGKLIFKDGLIKGIKSLITTFVKAVKEAPTKALGALEGFIGNFVTIGANLVGGLIRGLGDGVKNVGRAAANLATGAVNAMKKKLGIASAAKVIKVLIGYNIGKGLINGMRDKVPAVKNMSTKVGETVIEATKDALVKGEPEVKKTSTDMGEAIPEEMAKGITKSTPKVKNAVDEMGKTVYETTKEWVDKRRTYYDLSLEDELSKWKEIQDKYKKDSDERLKIDKRIAEIKKQMDVDSFNHSVNWMENEKFYKRLSLKEEIEGWERIQARYEKGSEERKKADREIFRLKNEMIEKQIRIDEDYYNKTKEINERLKNDVRALKDEYIRAVEDRTKALADAYGLFDEVTKPEDPVSGRTLLKNLNDQVKAFDSWQENINKLARKGIDEGLLEELRAMGPKSLEQIEALNSLSRSELDKYSSLWKEKYKKARRQATSELVDLKQETKEKIDELTKQADIELEEYKKVWMDKHAELTGGVVQEYQTMNKEVATTIGELRKETKAEFVDMVGEIKSVINEQRWDKLGENIMLGIIEGISSKIGPMIATMEIVAKAALNAAENTLGIHSRSEELFRVGEESCNGLSEGLLIFAYRAVNAARDMGNMTLSAIATSLSGINDILESDMDPVIRPVLDLSSVSDGVNTINDIFSDRKLRVVGSTNRAATIRTKNDISQDLGKVIGAEFRKAKTELSGTITVEVRNDQGEIIGIAETAVRDLLRREAR